MHERKYEGRKNEEKNQIYNLDIEHALIPHHNQVATVKDDQFLLVCF